MSEDTQTQYEAARCGLLSYAEAYGSLRGLFIVLGLDLETLDRRLANPHLDKEWVHEEFVRSVRDIVNSGTQTINTFRQQQ